MISTDYRKLLGHPTGIRLAEDPYLEKMNEWQADIYGPNLRQAFVFCEK
jgi:hypothetical protein